MDRKEGGRRGGGGGGVKALGREAAAAAQLRGPASAAFARIFPSPIPVVHFLE